jgi:hypothetical protein
MHAFGNRDEVLARIGPKLGRAQISTVVPLPNALPRPGSGS